MWSGVFLFLRSRPNGLFWPQGDHSPHPLREVLCQIKGEECMPCAMRLSGSLNFSEKCMGGRFGSLSIGHLVVVELELGLHC